MHTIVYQIFHPWHWLTYGQNATAVAALAGILALIGLFLYTRYTEKMMQLQESTMRATITPILIAKGDIKFIPTEMDPPDAVQSGLQQSKVTKYRATLLVRNIGQGAALFLEAWHQQVAEKFVTNGSILARTTQAQKASSGMTELIRGESTSIVSDGFRPEDLNQRWLFVVEAIDQTSRRHQLQLLRSPLPNGQTETSIRMVHQPDNYDSWWRRLTRKEGDSGKRAGDLA
ncbi:MAG: hypothetical protein CXZ00_04900 [Acidobacteria bacterium]|nr:MAG: hypothetical protein CXZ00_04900 [Acidobacteriota bacterium]